MANLSFNIDDVIKSLTGINEKVDKATKLYADTAGKKMVADAKKNAKWTDRTALSRQTIDKTVENKVNQTDILLRGNTPHFKYLEIAMEKRFAILWPTINKMKSEIVQGWARLLSKIR